MSADTLLPNIHWFQSRQSQFGFPLSEFSKDPCYWIMRWPLMQTLPSISIFFLMLILRGWIYVQGKRRCGTHATAHPEVECFPKVGKETTVLL